MANVCIGHMPICLYGREMKQENVVVSTKLS